MQPVSADELSFVELLGCEGVTERIDLKTRFGFMAYHGGNLERRTETVASEAAAASGASLYTVTQPIGTRYHVPSAVVGSSPSPALEAFLDHCDVVVSIHGYGREGRWTDLLLGGRHRELAVHVADSLGSHLPDYNCVSGIGEIPAELRGLHPDNPCNLTTGGGVQIELPPRVRGLDPGGHVWRKENPPPAIFPDLLALAAGLAHAAQGWKNAKEPAGQDARD